jgi:hypothetical protein
MATSSPSSPDADDMISIRVKSVVGRHPPFIVRLSLSRDTLGSLKQAIHAETTFPASSQTLVHVGQTLRLDARTRLSESLQGDSTVFLVVRHADGRPGSGPRWSAGTAAEGAASSGESKNDASSASAASVTPTSTTASDPDTCRICFDGDSADSGPRRLFSPCLCSGSMSSVHVECLNAWRRASNNSTSYYACDQCRYKYRFQRTWWAELTERADVQNAAVALIFLVAVLIAGIPAGYFHHYFCRLIEWSPPWHSPDYLYADAAAAATEDKGMFVGALDHVVAGSAVVGLCGFALGEYRRIQLAASPWQSLLFFLAWASTNGPKIMRLLVLFGGAFGIFQLSVTVRYGARVLLQRLGETVLSVRRD